jgi:hypothetical protein
MLITDVRLMEWSGRGSCSFSEQCWQLKATAEVRAAKPYLDQDKERLDDFDRRRVGNSSARRERGQPLPIQSVTSVWPGGCEALARYASDGRLAIDNNVAV